MKHSDGDLAALLREAREREGWSKRELASRLGVARATVREIEDGRDARWSTLSALARTLPDALPPCLLPTSSPRVPPRSTAAWDCQREMMGASARRLIRSVRCAADGSLEVEEVVLGARRHGASKSDGLEGLLHRLHQGPRGPLMKALAAGPLSTGTELAFDLEERSWVYRIHGSAASPRVDATLRWTLPAVPPNLEPMEAARAQGAWLAPELCVEKLELRLELPIDVPSAEALLQPRALVLSTEEARAWTRAHHAAGATATARRKDAVLIAEYARPLVGLACVMIPSKAPATPGPARPVRSTSGPGNAASRARGRGPLGSRARTTGRDFRPDPVGSRGRADGCPAVEPDRDARGPAGHVSVGPPPLAGSDRGCARASRAAAPAVRL